MNCRFANSPLLPWFCYTDPINPVAVSPIPPPKNALPGYADWLPSEPMRPIINHRLGRAALATMAQAPQPLGMNELLNHEVSASGNTPID